MEHSLIALQWLPCPIVTNLAKEAMLDRIPFGSPCWIVTDRDCHPRGIDKPMLQGVFPEADTATVVSAAIRQKQQGRGLRVVVSAKFSPPPAQSVNGKFCCIP